MSDQAETRRPATDPRAVLDPAELAALRADILARGRRARATRRRRSAMLAIVVALAAVGSAVWNDLGSEDFTLVPDGVDPFGAHTVRSRHRNQSFSVRSDTLVPPEEVRRRGERLLALGEANEWSLRRVTGWTIGGVTRVKALGVLRGDDEGQLNPVPAHIPINDIESEEDLNRDIRFLQQYGAESKRRARDGRAESIGYMDIMVSGQVVRVHRWRMTYPEFGTVIYWDSGMLAPSP